MNLRGVSKGVWVRVIALVLVLVNLISVSFFNFQLLPFTDAQLYEGASVLVTVVVGIWTTWKNNSFTKEAQRADEIMKFNKSK